MLSPEAIQEFKQLYREEFGEELPDQAALEKATKLINLFKVIYRPIPKRDGDSRENKS